MILALPLAHSSSRLGIFSLLIAKLPVCGACNAMPSHTLDAKVHSSRVRCRVAYDGGVYDATPPVFVGSARTSHGQAALRPGRIWRCKLHSCNSALLPRPVLPSSAALASPWELERRLKKTPPPGPA